MERRWRKSLSVYDYLKGHPEGVNARMVADKFGISYFAAYGRLRRLYEAKLIRRKEIMKDKMRRVDWFPIAKYVRMKVRLYNETLEPTPTGQFQGFYEVDGLLDELNMPVVDYEWTKIEVEHAKRDMWTEFNINELSKLKRPYEEFTQKTLFDYDYEKKPEEIKGIGTEVRKLSIEEKKPKYGKLYPPEEYLGAFTVEELIWGASNKKPVSIYVPEGVVYKERLIVIKKMRIDYDSGWFTPRIEVVRI